MSNLLDVVFGCWHPRYSFPITIPRGQRRRGAASVTGTYVACLECGKELPYDWQRMKVLSSSTKARAAVGSLATKEAA